jgi:hypothetical protein
MDFEMSIDFYQILYHENQRQELYPFAKPYFSVGLTPYFENSFIAGLVPTCSSDYISVCSWRLRRKRGDAVHYLGGIGKDELTLEKIEAADFDVAILTPHSPSHKPLVMAANWHGKAWTDAYEAFKPFLAKFGKIPQELTNAIYENHFIAKREIYQDYVKNWLIPAIEFMDYKDVFFQDSNYLPKKKDQSEIMRVQWLLNRKDWPITPFILERLFSFYIEGKGFKVTKI